MDRVIEVVLPAAGGSRYEVTVGVDCLERALAAHAAAEPAPCWAVVSDEAVATGAGAGARRALSGSGAQVVDLRLEGGEASKSRESAGRLQDEAIAAGLRRDGVVVAVGGGVTGDLAGFVAATLFRGVRCVQVPTTLLAMVDAAIGGKTGVDTPAGKNLVGAFHQPAAVVADVAMLETLPERHLRAGLAEVIKYGVIVDEQLFVDLEDGLLESCLARVPEALVAVVARCVELKGEIVAGDEHERGRRQILNYGHTVAHAVETAADYAVLHGEAVAIGMVVEGRLAERLCDAPPGLAARVAELCGRAGLPTALPAGTDPQALLELAGRDKKVRAARIRCALPREFGRMAGAREGWSIAVEPEALVAAFAD